MYFRLAALSGCATVEEFLDRTSSSQLSEWIAYRSIELLPDERLELLLASIAALLANQWRGEDDTPATPADFMPWLPEDDDDEKPTDMVAMIEHLNMVFGGDDLRETVSQETTWAP